MMEQNSKDLKWALGLNQMGAELLGVWPSEKEPWHVKVRVPFMMILLLFWICLPQTWALMLVIENLSLVIDNLMSNSAAFSAFFKLFFLWRSKTVVESTARDWLRFKSVWEREVMLKQAFKMRLVTIVDYTITGLSLVGFIGFPLLDIDIRLLSNVTDYAERHLLVQSYYPFDYSPSPIFELTLGLQYLGALFSGLAVTVPENYFGALVIHASAQFEILGLELEHLFRTDNTDDKARLNNLIDRHVHLIAIITALESSFAYVTLVQVICTSIILCSYGFQFLAIVGASDQETSFLQMITLVGIIFTLMSHTLVDCFVGESLAMRSTSLINSLYNCRWYAVSGKRARDLIPMMIMSRNQKPLTAGKILPLTLATYCSIFKTTAGYISMLLAVHTK